MDELISIDEAAKMLGLNPARIRSLLRSPGGREKLPLILKDKEPGVPFRCVINFYDFRNGSAIDRDNEKNFALYRNDVEAYMKEKGMVIYQEAGLVEKNIALENAFEDTKKQLAIAKERIAELEAALANKTDCDGHGVLSFIINLRMDGKDEESIALFLKQHGLSTSQVGVLLHPDPLSVGQAAISSHAKRLLKK